MVDGVPQTEGEEWVGKGLGACRVTKAMDIDEMAGLGFRGERRPRTESAKETEAIGGK